MPALVTRGRSREVCSGGGGKGWGRRRWGGPGFRVWLSLEPEQAMRG